jgi:hypothetical protein
MAFAPGGSMRHRRQLSHVSIATSEFPIGPIGVSMKTTPAFSWASRLRLVKSAKLVNAANFSSSLATSVTMLPEAIAKRT